MNISEKIDNMWLHIVSLIDLNFARQKFFIFIKMLLLFPDVIQWYYSFRKIQFFPLIAFMTYMLLHVKQIWIIAENHKIFHAHKWGEIFFI